MSKFVLMDAATDTTGSGSSVAATPWYQGVPGMDQETIGHITTKGWDKKSAAEAAYEAVKAYRSAEHFIGAPPTELIRVPKDPADELGWKNVWERLGTPKDAKEYDFGAVKFSDGTDLDEGFVNLMRENALKNHIPKDAAVALTSEFAKFLDSVEQRDLADRSAKLAEQKAALEKNWGPNKEANLFVAKRAAAALELDPETVASLENVIGYDKIMEMFRKIGSKIGEDKFVTNSERSGSGVMTREEAMANKSSLMNDKVWVASYLKGDAEKIRQMTALNTIIVG